MSSEVKKGLKGKAFSRPVYRRNKADVYEVSDRVWWRITINLSKDGVHRNNLSPPQSMPTKITTVPVSCCVPHAPLFMANFTPGDK